MEGSGLAAAYALHSQPRQPGHPNRDRASGFVPGVMYGHRVAPVALRVEARDLALLLHRGGAHHLVELTVEGVAEPHTVVLKEIQRNPVSRQVVHVDFQAVSAAERIHASVPLRLLGEETVTKAGRILQWLLHSVHVSCLPANLPDHIEVDVSAIAVGHSVTVHDLRVPGAISILNEGDEVILSVLAPRTAEPEAAATPAEGASDSKA